LLVSIDGGTVRSQPGSGSDTPPATDDDDAPSGSGSALVAPVDPAQRLGWLKGRFEAAISGRPQIARAKIGFHVVDVATKAVLVSREPDRGLNLASNTKVVTAVAALTALGSGFRWRTAVFCNPPDANGNVIGDLYIRGRGDPVLSLDALDNLALEVAARGVRTVEGKLVVDDTYFDSVTEPPHFGEQPKERAAVRAPIASFAVARSAYTVVVLAEPGNAPAKVTVEPHLPGYLEVSKNDVTSIIEGRTRLRLEAKPRPNAIDLEISGQIRNGLGTWDLKRRVDDPARYAAEVFKRALAKHGVRLRSRAIAYAPVPVNLRQIAVHDSPTLGDVLRPMNKHSDNNIAETIYKTIGAEARGTPGATWADAQTTLKAQLAKLGVAGAYRIENGSGLFASTEVSPKQLVGLLLAAHGDYRIGPDLLASLPVGGYDGTLARRWHGRPAQGRVRAKTGTLDKVVTLAGYVGVDGLRPLAFAILVNDIPAGQRPQVKAMIDDMVDSLAAYLDAK
jgi:serine-type D-Ala-D-Ala carboxypeptidase/endopeptidase (penicillin-binding protein 4)